MQVSVLSSYPVGPGSFSILTLPKILGVLHSSLWVCYGAEEDRMKQPESRDRDLGVLRMLNTKRYILILRGWRTVSSGSIQLGSRATWAMKITQPGWEERGWLPYQRTQVRFLEFTEQLKTVTHPRGSSALFRPPQALHACGSQLSIQAKLPVCIKMFVCFLQKSQ